MTITSPLGDQRLVDLINAVRQKRRIEKDAREWAERAHERFKIAIESRSAAEAQLSEFLSLLVDGDIPPIALTPNEARHVRELREGNHRG